MFKFLSRKQTPVWSIIVSGKEGIPAWSKFNQEEAAKAYAKIDTVYSCIDLIASGFSQSEFKAVSTNAKGEKTESFDHPALELLASPGTGQSQSSLLYSYVAWKLITGSSYMYLNNGETGETQDFSKPPIELNMLASDRMKIVPGDKGIQKYEYSANGQTQSFPVDMLTGDSNVMFSKFFNPTDDFYGLSPMQALAKNIDMYESALNWNKGLLDNSARPSGMFTWTGEGNPTADQIADIRKMIKDNTGEDNAGKPLFGGKLDFKQMSLSPKDMEFMLLKSVTQKDITRGYKVPPILLNIGSDATFANMADARLALWDEAIIPLLKCFVSEFNMNVMPRYQGNELLELNLDNITALEPRRQKQWDRAQSADFLTFNERRNIVGYEDVDDGDEILVNASMVPLSFAAGDFTDTGDGTKKKA
jgi:HK97 family phage portal protein